MDVPDAGSTDAAEIVPVAPTWSVEPFGSGWLLQMSSPSGVRRDQFFATAAEACEKARQIVGEPAARNY
jgi:hypothetical protein